MSETVAGGESGSEEDADAMDAERRREDLSGGGYETNDELTDHGGVSAGD